MMNILDAIRNKLAGTSSLSTPPPVVQELSVSRSTAPAPVFLKKGMWVRTADGIGIAVAFFESGEVEVHLTNDMGETIAVHRMEAAAIQGQARYEDIPAPRRPAREVAASLGYV